MLMLEVLHYYPNIFLDNPEHPDLLNLWFDLILFLVILLYHLTFHKCK